MSNPEGKVPPEAKNFSFPEEAGLAEPKKEAIQPKYVVGQVVKNWGPADEFNDVYLGAVRAGWIDEKCALTKEGVEYLLDADKKKEIVQPLLSITTRETPLLKSKYVVGQVVDRWGPADEFNEEYQAALKAGLITKERELTEAGVAELVRLDAPKPIPVGKIEDAEEAEVSDEATSSPTPPEPRPAFMTSATARQRGHESLMGDDGRKRLMDSIQSALEERGFNVLDVYVEEKSNEGGEKIYTLSIEFAPTGGKDRGKKEKKTLRLVGSEDSLVTSLRHDSFNIPTTQHPNKKLKRVFDK